MKITISNKKCEDTFRAKDAPAWTLMKTDQGTTCLKTDIDWGSLGCIIYFCTLSHAGDGSAGPYTKFTGSICLEND